MTDAYKKFKMFSILANFNFVTCENTPDIRYLISFFEFESVTEMKKKGKNIYNVFKLAKLFGEFF